jgi:glycosyltransferase involved in cell wall biosynthesis
MSAPSLRVVVDGRPLVGNLSGIGVHTAELAARLGISPPPLIASHAPIDDRTSIDSCRFRVDSAPLGVLWQQILLPRIATEEGADVVWGPHGTLPLRLMQPAVATIHDLTSITMPGRHKLSTMMSFNLFIGASLQKAAAVAAVSRTTADEAIRGFGIARRKIEIVPNGVDPFFSPASPHDLDDVALPAGIAPRGYLLYVGTIEPRKGLPELLAAWSSLRVPRPQLVVCGDRGWGTAPRNRDLESNGIHRLGFASRGLLRALYRHALAFVYPSWYEGFGLPPLEAMACGTPVVTTRAGAIPEVVDDAALLVEPGDSEAVREAIERILESSSLRLELRERGLARAALFNWDRSAELMTGLLQRAAGGR